MFLKNSFVGSVLWLHQEEQAVNTLVGRLVTDHSGALLTKYGLIAAAIAMIGIIAALGNIGSGLGTNFEALALLS